MELPLPNEHVLVYQLKQGDRNAFDKLFQKYSSKIFRFAYRYLQCREDAEEIVQEVFLKIWDRRSKLDEKLSFSSFLYTITQRTALNVIRKRRNNEKVMTVVFAEAPANSNFVEEDLFANQLLEQTRAAIESLSPQRKRIFTMSREQFMSYEQIAVLLKISKNTVESQMVLALKHVRKCLHQVGISRTL